MFKKTLLALATLSIAISATAFSGEDLQRTAQNVDWDEDKDVTYCQLKLVKYETSSLSSSYHMFDIGSKKVLHFQGLSGKQKPSIHVGRTILSNCKMDGTNLIVEHALRTDFMVANEINESIMDWTVIGNKDVDQYYGEPYQGEEKDSFWDLF